MPMTATTIITSISVKPCAAERGRPCFMTEDPFGGVDGQRTSRQSALAHGTVPVVKVFFSVQSWPAGHVGSSFLNEIRSTPPSDLLMLMYSPLPNRVRV